MSCAANVDRRVGGHRLRGDRHRRVEVVPARKGLRDQHRRRRAAGRRTRHQPRHHARHEHRRSQHLVDGHFLAEQRHRIVRRVPARLGADLRERLELRPVLLHVRQAGSAEVADRERHVRRADERVGLAVEIVERRRAIVEMRAERAGRHLLEAQRQRAVDDAALDRLPREEERRGAGRAVVVDVEDRDAGHADVVERLLARRGVAVHVADERLLHVDVRDAGVGQRRRAPPPAPIDVVGLARARLRERDHSDAGDKDLATHRSVLCRQRRAASLRRLVRHSSTPGAHFTGFATRFPAAAVESAKLIALPPPSRPRIADVASRPSESSP